MRSSAAYSSYGVAVRPKREGHSKTVQTRAKKRSASFISSVCVVLTLIGLIAFCNLYQRVIIIQNSLKTQKVSAEIENNRNITSNLENQLTTLKNPQRIKEMASKIGMVEAKHAGYIYLNKPKQGRPQAKIQEEYKMASLLSFFGSGWSPNR